MHIIDINLIGVMYTFKLAVHYFRRSPLDGRRDRCFIFGGSIAGYLDNLVRAASHAAPLSRVPTDAAITIRVVGSIQLANSPSEGSCEQ